MSEDTDAPQEGTQQQITETQFYQEMIGSQRPENARIFWYQDTGERIRKENSQLLTFVQQLSHAEVLYWCDTEHYFDPRRMYMCPFCTPGEAGETNEGEHAPDCLVIQAKQFLEQRKATQE